MSMGRTHLTLFSCISFNTAANVSSSEHDSGPAAPQ
jgi:hypothetical protein